MPSNHLVLCHPLLLLSSIFPALKRSRTLWPFPTAPPPTISSAFLLSVENFNQRINLIREVRNAETMENFVSVLRRLNNNKVVIKHRQGPLVLSQGLYVIFWAKSCDLSYRSKPQVEELTTWWPDCTQDFSCHNSENWPQRNGNKSTPELKIAAAAAKLLQSCPTLCDPMDCSLPGSSVHGIFQARVLEWGAIAFSKLKINCT